jgi:hypothetical protein
MTLNLIEQRGKDNAPLEKSLEIGNLNGTRVNLEPHGLFAPPRTRDWRGAVRNSHPRQRDAVPVRAAARGRAFARAFDGPMMYGGHTRRLSI